MLILVNKWHGLRAIHPSTLKRQGQKVLTVYLISCWVHSPIGFLQGFQNNVPKANLPQHVAVLVISSLGITWGIPPSYHDLIHLSSSLGDCTLLLLVLTRTLTVCVFSIQLCQSPCSSIICFIPTPSIWATLFAHLFLAHSRCHGKKHDDGPSGHPLIYKLPFSLCHPFCAQKNRMKRLLEPGCCVAFSSWLCRQGGNGK